MRPRLPLEPVIAVRAGGERVWGSYPYHAAAAVGGRETLRGFEPRRFSGDAALFAGTELRMSLTHVRPLGMQVGLVGVADAGRVFLSGEHSGTWHVGAGGGVWGAVLDRLVVNAVVVGSQERAYFYLYTGVGS
jgi:hypothetical protein